MEERISLRAALSDVLRSMPWHQFFAWVVAITVLPVVSLLFNGYRIRYQRLVLAGGGAIPRFDWHKPFRDVGTAYALLLITALLTYGAAGLLHFAILRPLHVVYDTKIVLLVVGVLFAVVYESLVVVAILRAHAGGSRLRHFAASIQQRPLAFALCGLGAMAVRGVWYVSDRLVLPTSEWAGPLDLPRFDEPAAVGTYYAAMAVCVCLMLLGGLVVGHLFAQFGRDPKHELEAEAAEPEDRAGLPPSA